MKNFIEIYDNVLSDEECKYVIDFMNQENVLVEGLINKGGESVVSKDDKESFDISMNVDDVPPDYLDQKNIEVYKKVNKIILSKLFPYFLKYKKVHPQLNKIKDWRLHQFYNLQKYFPNQGFKKVHCEVMNTKSVLRIGAWMIYLNDLDNGGTYFDNYDLTVNAVRGRLVIWPSYWTHFHRGVISTTQTKYIATGWLRFVKDNSSSPLDWILGNN